MIDFRRCFWRLHCGDRIDLAAFGEAILLVTGDSAGCYRSGLGYRLLGVAPTTYGKGLTVRPQN